MDLERKVNLCEGVPLNSTGAANIFLNTGKNTKVNSPDGTVIHLKTEKPADLGVHINTTLSIASSKKIKLLFILNFLLSVICMIISCSVAFYYWNEMVSMRRQLDTIKEQFLIQSYKDESLDSVETSALVAPRRWKSQDREARMKDQISPSGRRYFVENLGEDLLFVDSSKKSNNREKTPLYDIAKVQKDLQIIQFNGALTEVNLGTQPVIGPWVRDNEVSSKNSESTIILNDNYVTVQEGGLYLVYAQIVYLTHAPNCYFIWAHQPNQDPRMLTTCASGGDSSNRPLDKSQISCSTSTVARLYKGDTVNLAQRERNRTLWLKQGYSYFGFVKLSS